MYATFCETIIGALIFFGLFVTPALVLSGMLLAALTFGTLVPGFPTVAHNTQYALVHFVLLWLADLNSYSLDRLFNRQSPRD